MNEFVEDTAFQSLIQDNRVLIDVRSESEYQESHFPSSINIPILSDEERRMVGKTYKEKGQAEAIRLGTELVSGSKKKDRVSNWIKTIQEHPNAILTCFRGGLRSQYAQDWCQEAGFRCLRLRSGTKGLRRYLLESLASLSAQTKFVVLSGPTGSGKTKLLQRLSTKLAVLDLESEAEHRGSVFGDTKVKQPAQATFENRLAYKLIQHQQKLGKSVLVEDESKMIGLCALPNELFNKIRQAPIILVEEPLEARVRNIYEEYILKTDLTKQDMQEGLKVFESYEKAVNRISRKLGGLRTSEVLSCLQNCKKMFEANRSLEENSVWIAKLLEWYYDPAYAKDLEQRKHQVILSGSFQELILSIKASRISEYPGV